MENLERYRVVEQRFRKVKDRLAEMGLRSHPLYAMLEIEGSAFSTNSRFYATHGKKYGDFSVALIEEHTFLLERLADGK